MGAAASVNSQSSYASIFEAGSNVAEGFIQSGAMTAAGEATRDQYETNARLSEWKAEDALRRGHIEAGKYRTKVKQMVGSQRASLAASGVDISATGSAQDVITETYEMGAMDALTIENNAYRESWGLKFEASESRFQGKIANMTARANARNTLLTSGLRAVSKGFEAYGGPAGKSNTGVGSKTSYSGGEAGDGRSRRA